MAENLNQNEVTLSMMWLKVLRNVLTTFGDSLNIAEISNLIELNIVWFSFLYEFPINFYVFISTRSLVSDFELMYFIFDKILS